MHAAAETLESVAPPTGESTQKHSAILAIPPEIRLLVYEYMLSPSVSGHVDLDHFAASLPTRSLLHVSRLIRFESLEIYTKVDGIS